MKTRALLSIIISILTGFAIGYISANQIRHIKMKDMRSMSSVEAFTNRAFEIIEPTKEQKEKITPIVNQYAIQFDSLRKNSFEIYKNFFDEFHVKVFPYLDDNQKDRLSNYGKYHGKHSDDHPPKK